MLRPQVPACFGFTIVFLITKDGFTIGLFGFTIFYFGFTIGLFWSSIASVNVCGMQELLRMRVSFLTVNRVPN